MVTLLIACVAAGSAPVNLESTMTIIDDETAALNVDDFAVQFGDGIFESILVVDGTPYDVAGHLERFEYSAGRCMLPLPDPDQWRAAISVAVSHTPASGNFTMKLVLSRGRSRDGAPNAWITVRPAPDHSRARLHGISVRTFDRGFVRDFPAVNPWLLVDAKTLSYGSNMAALRQVHAQGADDVIFVSSDGFLLEAATANVVIRDREGRFLTPRADGSILHGTTQRRLFEYLNAAVPGSAEYADLTLDDLRSAAAAWFVSSIRLAAPVKSVNGAGIQIDSETTAELNALLLS